MISFREYTNEDIDRLVTLANNEKVSKYLIYTFPYPYTRQDAEWWISKGCHENDAMTKVIEYKNEFVGSIGITPQLGWKSHIAEIGYWIGEEYWGKGIATQALQKMTECVLEQFKYKKLFAPVLAPNNISIRVLEKCDYELEGVLKNEVYKNDQYYDLYHYAKCL